MTVPVVLTGGTGVLGGQVRPLLGDRPVLLLARRSPTLRPNEQWASVDLAHPFRLENVPVGSALCHLAYSMGDGARNVDFNGHVVDAVNTCPKITHVVLLSSVAVYGAALTGHIDERTACSPDSEYARTKLACERLWFDRLRADCRLTVLRPTAIVAPTGPSLVALARDAVQRPWRGIVKRGLNGRATVHFVAVTNVAAALLLILDRSDGHSRGIFIVSDDEDPANSSYAAMQDSIRAAFGLRPLRSILLPRWAEIPVGRLVGRRLGVRRTFSSAALHALGFRKDRPLAAEITTAVRIKLPGARERGH